MKAFLTVFAAAFVLIGAVAAQEEKKKEEAHGDAVWIADFDKAVEQAKKDKKDLLVDFTGSDWCTWCIKLHKEVFDHAAFTDEAAKSYVFCALDFPNGDEAKAKVPNADRNKELMEKYGIQGFPSILLMTTEGEVFARTGYQAGGPEKYVAHLAEIATSGKKAIAELAEMKKAFAAADAKAKPDLVEKAAAKLLALKDEQPGKEIFVEIVKTGLTLDAENKTGLKAKSIKALIKAGSADAQVQDEARKLDPKNEMGMLELVVNADLANIKGQEDLVKHVKAINDLDALGPIKDKDIAKNLYVNAAFWSQKFLKNDEDARRFAKKAKAFAADDKRLNDFLDSILKEEEKKEGGEEKKEEKK